MSRETGREGEHKERERERERERDTKNAKILRGRFGGFFKTARRRCAGGVLRRAVSRARRRELGGRPRGRRKRESENERVGKEEERR